MASEPQKKATIVGVWFRYKPDQPNEFERYFFREDGTAFVWQGGHTSDGISIEPRILKGSYIQRQPKKVEIAISHWPFSSLEYGICGDRLVMKDAKAESAELMAFTRVAEWCWDIPDAYPDECYPR